MRITYTGRQVELAPAQLRKIQERASKLGKLLDGKDEREAHVILGLERGRHTAEITTNYHNHPLVGVAENPDLTLGALIAHMGLGDWFRRYYLLPMAGAIWSCPAAQMMVFPARMLVRFFAKHGASFRSVILIEETFDGHVGVLGPLRAPALQ